MTPRCAECGTTSDDGTGWRAYLAGGDDDDPDVEVVVICAACAVREFGATR